MILKNICGALLCAGALVMASCSSEIDTNDSNVTNSKDATEHYVSITPSSAETRSTVNPYGLSEFEKGDLFLVYDITNPHGFEALYARTGGVRSKFDGRINCNSGDDIALFFPLRYNYTGSKPGTVELSMQENTISKNGELVTKQQDGTLATLSNFDYSWALIKNIQMSGNIVESYAQFAKQYSLLKVKFEYEGVPLKNITKVTLKNVTRQATFNLATGEYSDRDNSGFTVTPQKPVDELFIAVFPDVEFHPTFLVETADGNKYWLTMKAQEVKKSKFYDITVKKVKDPWIDVVGTKWGKYNLQFEMGTQVEGWLSQYHLAKKPWDFFYTESYPLYQRGQRLPGHFTTDKFDHFRWGDIAKAHHYNYCAQTHFWNASGDIQKQVTYHEDYGDVAYYVSRGTWRMPSQHDYEQLMCNTVGYIGHYNDNGNDVIGVLYVPTTDRNLKGTTRWKGGFRRSNTSAWVNLGGYGTHNSRLIDFTEEDIDKGVFFPFAGSYQMYYDCDPRLDKPGSQMLYWTSTGTNATQAVAFTAYYNYNGCVGLPTVSTYNNQRNPKHNMYSIRPIFIGEQQKYKK